ncbi:hypothetical protein LDO32_11695 [Luteimonas sp. Y-2-2-4F]|nr:hypothetical protein [Luteimonas sp. Y-2-2-4F]MCD9032388.1 hypothetical protein [Luteimonas sp. Y-2-2-4F]
MLPAVLSLLLAAACDAERGPAPATGPDRPTAAAQRATPFDGRPYLGSVEVRASVPGRPGDAIHDSGVGSAYLEAAGSQPALVLGGDIKDEGDAAFLLRGRRDGDAWRSEGDVEMVIAPDGTVSGQGTVSNQRLAFDGRVDDRTFDLDVEVQLTSANAKGLPAGTTFRFSYRLRRDADAGPGAPSKDGEPCKRFVWRVRNIADFAGGPMQMIQVPECVG